MLTPCAWAGSTGMAHPASGEVGDLLDGRHIHEVGLGAVHASGGEVLGIKDGLAGLDPRPLKTGRKRKRCG